MAERTVIIIVGLSGSGKTHLANQLANSDTVIIDDPKDMAEVNNNLSDNVIITDPNLCIEVYRNAAKEFFTSKGYKIEWIYFENNKEQCLKNVLYRNDGRKVDTAIERHSKAYEIPKYIIPRKVWVCP